MIYGLAGLLIAVSVIFLILGRLRCSDVLEYIDEDEYSMKALIPAGYFIIDLLKLKLNSKADHKLLQCFIELKGKDNASGYLFLHWANKITSILLGMILIAVIMIGRGKIDTMVVILSATILAGLGIGPDRDIQKKIEERHRSIRIDFPDFLNKYILLLGAGMTNTASWFSIVKNNKKDSALYFEADLVVQQVNSGVSMDIALENFARRCRMSEITKFVSALIQNLSKGGAELSTILSLQSKEAWEMRKVEAKKQGEEAGSKLLFPMMLMLFAVLVLVVTPAVLIINKN